MLNPVLDETPEGQDAASFLAGMAERSSGTPGTGNKLSIADMATVLTLNQLCSDYLSRGSETADIRRILAAMEASRPDETGEDDFNAMAIAKAS